MLFNRNYSYHHQFRYSCMSVIIIVHFVISVFSQIAKGVLVERILPDKQWQENKL